MPDVKPPLFNRTYLKIIIWVVAIAIVLLTAGNNSNSEFIRINKHAGLPLYYVDQDKASQLQISVLFHTGAAINSEQQLLQQLLLQQIEQQLPDLTAQSTFRSLQATLNAGISSDKLKLLLILPAQHVDKTTEIKALVDTLLQQLRAYRLGSDLAQRWARLEATQYLNLKDPETRLLNTFGDLINNPASIHPVQRFANFYQRSLRPGAVTITLQGPNAERIAQQLSSLLTPLTDDNSNHTTIGSTRQQLASQGNQTYRLSGIKLSGRQQPHFATELLAVRTLQQLLEKPSAVTTRLIWKSLDKQGFLAMILQGKPINNEIGLSAWQLRLQAKLDDELINSTRERLQKNFHTQMEQIDAQLNLLDTIAFYQLPLDYLNRFETELSDVDNSAVREKVSHYLTGPERYQLLLPAY